MKVWRQAFSVQRVHTTLNAQPLQTLNLPIMAAQPQSLTPRSGAVIDAAARSSVIRHDATPNAQRQTPNLPMAPPPRFPAQRSTLNLFKRSTSPSWRRSRNHQCASEVIRHPSSVKRHAQPPPAAP
ncbi:MAG: hypothetical protein M0Q87_10675 [Ottowia sp.]|nr:hypothetical protein [Ottowia sp.]